MNIGKFSYQFMLQANKKENLYKNQYYILGFQLRNISYS